MTEEIKEILDLLNFNKDTILNRTCRVEDFMSREQIIKLLDYITNLQQENEKIKYNARGQVNDYFKNKYADEVLKNAELQREMNYYKKQYQNYKSRIDKALKYLGKCDWNDKHCFENLINILIGSDEK